MVWENPKLDWPTNPVNPTATDLNRIEGNIDFLKQDIETKKGAIVNALVSIGISVDLANTYAEIATAITNSNQGTKIITPNTSNIIIPKGFHDGNGYVKGDGNLVAGNIREGVSIFGKNGTYGSGMKKAASGLKASSEAAVGSYGSRLKVTGLAFTPSVVFTSSSLNTSWPLMYISFYNTIKNFMLRTSSSIVTANGSIVSNGFSIDVDSPLGTEIYWWVYE